MKVTIPYSPRPLQRQLHDNTARFAVYVCHRRFGKTVFAINKLIKAACLNKLQAPRYAYIAPIYRQAKQVAWDYLKFYTAAFPQTKVNESELRVDLINGATISLYGADNPDALRGIYLDGVVLDEYAQMSPRVWSEVIRPTLTDREGWAVFIGTPKGHNQFYDLYQEAGERKGWTRELFKASATGVLPQQELQAAAQKMNPEEYDQEFECSWQAAIRGAYYGRLMAKAEEEGRITRVPHDPALQVETWWDLGVGDSTAIWFVQRAGKEIHLIDYYEMSGEGLSHYALVLQTKGYVYSHHVAPHDIEARELGSGKSRKEQAQALGLHFTVAPKLPINHGIDVTRNLIAKCWFDQDKCRHGIEALKQYRAEYDDRLRTLRPTPLHDWSSHAADAFRYGAITQVPSQWGWDKPLAYPDLDLA